MFVSKVQVKVNDSCISVDKYVDTVYFGSNNYPPG